MLRGREKRRGTQNFQLQQPGIGLSQTLGRMQKADPPQGSVSYTTGVLGSRTGGSICCWILSGVRGSGLWAHASAIRKVCGLSSSIASGSRQGRLRVCHEVGRGLSEGRLTADSKRLEHGCRMTYAGFTSFFGLGSVDGRVPTFWLLLQGCHTPGLRSLQGKLRA